MEIIQWNLSAVPGKSVRYSGVRYIEVFNISRRKGKKDTLMHNNVLNLINTVTGKRVNRGAGLELEKPMDY